MALAGAGFLVGFILGAAIVLAQTVFGDKIEPEEDALTRAQRPPVDTRLRLFYEDSEYIIPQGSKESEAILGILDTWLQDNEEVF